MWKEYGRYERWEKMKKEWAKLKKKVKTKWVNALRSGKYRQGKGHLCEFNSKGRLRHCCLGVLGNIVGVDNESMNGWSMPSDIAWEGIFTKAFKKDSVGNISFNHLARLNDNKKSFKYIANWIEKNL
jgi:hypothetical protein